MNKRIMVVDDSRLTQIIVPNLSRGTDKIFLQGKAFPMLGRSAPFAYGLRRKIANGRIWSHCAWHGQRVLIHVQTFSRI